MWLSSAVLHAARRALWDTTVWPVWQLTGASPFARPQAANQYNRTHLDAQQRATLTQRDVHGGLFGGFGWEW